MPLHAGDVFAGYTIQRLLGAGGMGEVYLAQHPRLPRHDALKILPASLTSDAQYRDRFNREADIAASLWHQHIVALHDRGEADGQLWIAMDYVEGTDASRLIRERYPSGLPLKEATEIISAIADALDYAHARNLLHRDVKPANILLTRPDNGKLRIFLADFGVARRTDDVSDLTATNMTVGSMRYSAPEQLMGQPLDGRADQYALAATAYQLLTGHSPFNDTNPAVIITKHLSEPPPRVSQVRPELRHLDEVIARGLAKEPANRFALCGDFARALTEGGSAGSGGYTQPTTPTSAARLPPPPTAPQQPRSATGPSWPSNTAVPYPPTSPTTPAWAPTASEAPRDPSAPGLPRPKKRDRAKVVIPALLAVLLVASGVFAVSQFVRPAPVASDTPEWQPYVEAAKEFIVLMSSLGKNNANDVQKILDKSTGTFHSDYEKSALERKSSLLRYDINSKGTVNGAALESFKPGQADVLISSVQETTFPDKPSSTLNYLSVVTVVSTDDGYKTSALVPVK